MIFMNKTEAHIREDGKTIDITRIVDGKICRIVAVANSLKHFALLMTAFESYSDDDFTKECSATQQFNFKANNYKNYCNYSLI